MSHDDWSQLLTTDMDKLFTGAEEKMTPEQADDSTAIRASVNGPRSEPPGGSRLRPPGCGRTCAFQPGGDRDRPAADAGRGP